MAAKDESSLRGVCPFLGVRDEEGNPAPYVDYPSFENLCFVAERPDAVMLTDQATFCLSRGHRHCPRLGTSGARTTAQTQGSAPGVSGNTSYLSVSSDPLTHAIAEMETALEAHHVTRTRRRRQWGWFGAVAIFVSVLLCGGLTAAYVGWQLVDMDGTTAEAGTVTTIASAATLAVPPVYLILTATSESPSSAESTPDSLPAQSFAFPPAVTATQLAGASELASRADLASPNVTSQRLDGPTLQSAPQYVPGTATPAFDMLVQVPTRRPTPVMDLTIAIPAAQIGTPIPSPTPSPSPTPALGTPVVVFAADDAALESGECTRVSWHVENVRAVYYENLGVDGHGEREECIRDKPGDYLLTVILPNGGTQYYTVTVGMILPTETPTPTATHPPKAEPTATWTPVVPTDTPTPDMQYGVLLTVDDGTSHDCTSGTTCEIGLLLTNTSIGLDDLSVRLIQTGAWSVKMCRMDGVCSDTKLTIASVGPGNTALVKLLVEVPRAAAGEFTSYVLRALSERSETDAGSDPVTVEITGK